VLVNGEFDDDSRVPTGTTLADGGDSGLSGRMTNTKLDFVGMAVLGIVCKLSKHNSKYLTAHFRNRNTFLMHIAEM